jgi:hypothetical protein
LNLRPQGPFLGFGRHPTEKRLYIPSSVILSKETLPRYYGVVVMTDLLGVNLVELRVLRGIGLSDSSNLTVKLGVMLRS